MEMFRSLDYFNKFFANGLITDIMTQRNLYAKELVEKKELSTRSVWQNWKDVFY